MNMIEYCTSYSLPTPPLRHTTTATSSYEKRGVELWSHTHTHSLLIVVKKARQTDGTWYVQCRTLPSGSCMLSAPSCSTWSRQTDGTWYVQCRRSLPTEGGGACSLHRPLVRGQGSTDRTWYVQCRRSLPTEGGGACSLHRPLVRQERQPAS